MDDHARALLQHRWQEAAIQSDGGEQVRVERLLPIVIGQRQCAPARRRGTADVVDQDVEAAETIHGRLDDLIDPFARTDVCLDEPIRRAARRKRSCRRDHLSTSANEALDNCFANAPGSTRNQNSSAREIACLVCLRFMLHKVYFTFTAEMIREKSSANPSFAEVWILNVRLSL